MATQNPKVDSKKRREGMKIRDKNLIAGAAVLLMALVFAAGCGVDQAPVASTDEVALTPAARQIDSGGGNQDLENTIDVVYSNNGRTVTGVFGPDGGIFHVLDEKGPGKKDDIEVGLIIPSEVLDGDVEISMTVNGDDFGTLEIVYSPAGFGFDPSVDMRIDLGDDLVSNQDLRDITPYHLYEDGTTEPVEIFFIDKSSNATNIYAKVPGFSRYGLCGDDYSPDCGF